LLEMKLHVLIVTVSILATVSAQSRHCIDDFDLEDVQSYSYSIPHSDELHYWNDTQINYYAFGKLDDTNSDEETTISAGIYNGDTLIYKTEINCDKGNWRNTIFNKKGKYQKLIEGKLDTDKTSCKAGEPFDIILKVNNYHAMNWIFNAQAMQHKVNRFNKKYEGRVIAGKPLVKPNIKKPEVRVSSKYNAYQATRFVLEGTGRAKFNRVVFGQCNAWPKGMENQCQKVRNWVIARSKANFTEHTRRILIKAFPLDIEAPQGLGVFGNNMIVHTPLCQTEKYFSFFQPAIHADRGIPVKANGGVNRDRAWCCCTDMRTGKIFQDNPDKECRLMVECINEQIACEHAYDPEIGAEIQSELEEEETLIMGNVLNPNNKNTKTGVLADAY